MNESQVKIRLINWLLSGDENLTLGAEVPFGGRRADLISLNNGLATAFEIKALGDKVSRLEGQLEDYRRFFDFCFVVCEPENLPLVRSSIKKGYGIIVVGEGEVLLLRKSQRFKRHNKELLLSVLEVKDLKRLSNVKLVLKDDLCGEVAKRLSLERVRVISRVRLEERYGPATDLLKLDMGSVITIDDLQTITKRPPLDLSC
ncbi:sce7726 family protein [Microbulbifer sp. SSSA002]|uniref:sce7726 family protein n=1 Tax=Microbulbifer sp. SSSA002 TaxID=3243376 RepID=UPI004039D5F7